MQASIIGNGHIQLDALKHIATYNKSARPRRRYSSGANLVPKKNEGSDSPTKKLVRFNSQQSGFEECFYLQTNMADIW